MPVFPFANAWDRLYMRGKLPFHVSLDGAGMIGWGVLLMEAHI